MIDDFKENEKLWNISIPGRDTREAELGMVDDELKETLSEKSLDKYMHAGVFAYSASSYMLDVMEELSYIEDEEKATRLQSLCLKRIITDLVFGVEGSYGTGGTEEVDVLNRLIDWASSVFEGGKKYL